MQSCFYTGVVRHRRMTPKRHAFTFRTFMVYLDLDELDGVFKGCVGWSTGRPALARFRRADFMADPTTGAGPGARATRDLRETVRDEVERQTGVRPGGPIRLLTNLRYFGHIFNPVSIYYCFDPTGEKVEAIATQITNTPWRERHTYALLASDARKANRPGARALRWGFAKQFYVSPFMPMQMAYDWTFTPPRESLFVHMNVAPAPAPDPAHGAPAPRADAIAASITPGESPLRPPAKSFDATLRLVRREITPARSALLLARYPAHTVSIVARIYFEALRLRLKGVPGVSHRPYDATGGVATDRMDDASTSP